MTRGVSDPSVLVAMNSSHLLHRSSASGGMAVARPLPLLFAEPIVFDYNADGSYVLGPTSHDRTVSLAVAPDDAQLVALAGWRSVLDNSLDDATVKPPALDLKPPVLI